LIRCLWLLRLGRRRSWMSERPSTRAMGMRKPRPNSSQ